MVRIISLTRPRDAALVMALLSLLALPAKAGLVLEGVSGQARDNVLAHLALDDEPCEAPAWLVRQRLAGADAEVREALAVYGWYSPEITRSVTFDGECWEARIGIDPGPRVVLRDVEMRIGGEAPEPFVRIIERRRLKPGEPLSHVDYERVKRELRALASRQGYFAAAFEASRIDVYPEQRAADLRLVYIPGPRYRFGEIEFRQDIVDERLARRFLDFEPGQPYDAARIASLYEALSATGYFSQVDVRTEPRDAPEFDVPIEVMLTPARARVYTAGVGYGTDTGPKLRLGYVNRRRNTAGHQLEFSSSLSAVISEAGASYRLPLADPRAEWLSFDAGMRLEDSDTTRSETYKTGVKRIQKRPFGILETQFVDFILEEFTVGEDSGTSRLVLPGLSWTWGRNSGGPRPERGQRLGLTLQATTQAIGSDTTFAQAEFLAKAVRPLWRGARLLARADAGITMEDDFSELPASERFFAGGDQSVRGYDFKSLGPVDANGEVVGGSHKLVGSLELDQKVSNNWSAALFVDSGNAYDGTDFNLKTSVGAGVRWYSPLGPLRFDVGVPLANDAPDSFRIHITLGPDL